MARNDDSYDSLRDELSHRSGGSTFGSAWEELPDRVTGGVPEMTTGIEAHPGGPAVHLTGSESLEKNGGFDSYRCASCCPHREAPMRAAARL